jgi:ketosteroid isomerase-like protein
VEPLEPCCRRLSAPLVEKISENQKTMTGYDVVPVELIDAGEKVVAVAQMVGAGSTSEIALDDAFAFVFTFKGERVVREQAFRNREEALEAAGMPA